MADSPNVSLLFSDVCKMNASQISRLTKSQLTTALKNAIDSSSEGDCTITTDSLKSMLSDAVFQVRRELLSEQQRLFASFEQRFDERISEITEEISTVRRNFKTEQENLMSIVDSELEERLNRRCNLVLYGVEEADSSADADSRKAHDRDALASVLKTMNVPDDTSAFRIRRIGVPASNKCRLLHVVCKDVSTRNEILRNRTLLRTLEKKIFVQPDMTLMQQQTAKSLRAQLKHCRDSGENVVIRNNRIVPARKRS